MSWLFNLLHSLFDLNRYNGFFLFEASNIDYFSIFILIDITIDFTCNFLFMYITTNITWNLVIDQSNTFNTFWFFTYEVLILWIGLNRIINDFIGFFLDLLIELEEWCFIKYQWSFDNLKLIGDVRNRHLLRSAFGYEFMLHNSRFSFRCFNYFDCINHPKWCLTARVNCCINSIRIDLFHYLCNV